MTCNQCHASANYLHLGKPLCEDHYTKQLAKEMDTASLERARKEYNEQY